MQCALPTFLTHTVFKREGILEDFVHFYGVGSNISSARKLGIFRNGRFYLCGLNLRGTCRKLKAFFAMFSDVEAFPCGCLNPEQPQLVWQSKSQQPRATAFMKNELEYWRQWPIFHLCHRQSHLDSSDPRLCPPASARVSVHACLTQCFCSRLMHLLCESNARVAILPH